MLMLHVLTIELSPPPPSSHADFVLVRLLSAALLSVYFSAASNTSFPQVCFCPSSCYSRCALVAWVLQELKHMHTANPNGSNDWDVLLVSEVSSSMFVRVNHRLYSRRCMLSFGHAKCRQRESCVLRGPRSDEVHTTPCFTLSTSLQASRVSP